MNVSKDQATYGGAAAGAVLGFWVGGPIGAAIGGQAGYFAGPKIVKPSAQGKWTSAITYTDSHGRNWTRDLALGKTSGSDAKGVSLWSWLEVDSAGNKTNHTWNSTSTDFATVGAELDAF